MVIYKVKIQVYVDVDIILFQENRETDVYKQQRGASVV